LAKIAVFVGDLDDPAQIHDRDAVRDVLYHAQVVRDEQERHPEVALQVREQVEDLRLHRHVERRHRLVADDDVGLQGQGARNADALPLPARELVRKIVGLVRPQTHARHEFGDFAASRSAGVPMP
jgi:hypothetical protein